MLSFEKFVRKISNDQQTSIPSISKIITTDMSSDIVAIEKSKLHLEKQLIENNMRNKEVIQMIKGGISHPVQTGVP